MKLYIVRHGESTSNASLLHQHAQVELSDSGYKQAQSVAKRFLHIPIETIVSSPMTRAKQTAEAIQKVTQKEVVFTNLLKEVKKPTEFEGKSLTDPALQDAKERIKKHFSNPLWHYSDEENFSDLKDRTSKFLNYISQFPNKHIGVVSHGDFIRILVGMMIFEEDFTTDMYYGFQKHMPIYNAGLTMCERKENGIWHVLTWNDHAHLG